MTLELPANVGQCRQCHRVVRLENGRCEPCRRPQPQPATLNAARLANVGPPATPDQLREWAARDAEIKAQAERRATERSLLARGFPKQLELGFGHLDTETLRLAETLSNGLSERNGGTLAIVGPQGTGKTTLACLLAWPYATKAKYILADELRRKEWDAKADISAILNAPFLVIDQCTPSTALVGGSTDFKAVAAIVSRRHDNLKKTVVLSHLAESGLRGLLGLDFNSRCRHVQTLAGRDWRRG